MASRELTYAALLRGNRNFRFLWLGQVVSQLGDWFNAIAVYALLLDLTGSATAVAVMMVVQQLPSALLGPWAGALVDRFDRRRVMIAADICRAVIVLGLVLVDSASTVWLAYVIVGGAVLATSFFEPARSAIMPSLVSRDELLPANSLSSATWAVMLAVGASVGGLVAQWFGRDFAFVLNSLSFAASAYFLAQIRPPAMPVTPPATAAPHRGAGLSVGVAFLASRRDILAYVSIKGAWAMAGGILLLLTVFGERVFRLGEGAAGGIGILYAARGVGAGLGAWMVKALLGSDERRLARGVAPSYAAVGLCYAGLAIAPSIWIAALAIVGAHAAGSVLWVASTVLLQLNVPDHLRGRVFAIDLAVLTFMSAASGYATAFVLDHTTLGPRVLAGGLATLFVAPALAWAWKGARR
ncbi:MAG: MFS transporter [Acidobacteria bacterium]|nr:MFS transporter [Acidobacteriota bacterium]